METETNELHNQNYERGFELNVLKLLASTCDKHIEAVSESKWVQSKSSDPDLTDEDSEFDSVSNLLSSLFYDFSRSLQNETRLFNTFDLIQKSCDSIKKKLQLINYSKWNRIFNKNYKNVYYKLLKRSLDPMYIKGSEQLNDDFKIIFSKFDRSVNIWAHQVLYDDLNVEKSYNEPPQIQVIRFDMTGDVIITGGSEGLIKLWDVLTCKTIMSLKRHSGAITNIDVHPTNSFIVSSCEGGEIWLWEVSFNFYRPHRLLKSNYKFLWVRFLVNDSRSDVIESKVEPIGKMDSRDRIVWEKTLDQSLLVSLDASSTLRVYRMVEMLSSSSGDNVYTEITPLYYLDLFNHNITAYDLSRLSFNGTFLTAIGIEPLDKQDFENADLDCINTAMSYIKNDTFHKSNLNIKGRYRDLIGKSGFALLMIPLNDPSEPIDLTGAENGESTVNNKRQFEDCETCCCDSRLESSSTCINTCVFCSKPKFRENKRFCLSISHYDGKESVEPEKEPKSMFLWTYESTSEIEKFCNEIIPDFTFINNLSFENNMPNIPTMHYGKLASKLILPSCLGSCLGSERESEHFDKLFLNFVNDAHILSPDVCFANTSTNHISASDDAKIFLWSYEDEVFKCKQLTTKTIERWKSVTSMKPDSNRNELKASSNVSSVNIQDRTFKSNQKNKSYQLYDQYKNGYSSSAKTSVAGERETQTNISNNTLYVVVCLCWSSHDKYVCVADSMVSKYNYKKSITQARTNLSGLSFFTNDGKRISDFLHNALTYHVSCVSFNPVCEEVCVAASFNGMIVIMDVKDGVVLKKMSFGNSAIWLDIQWHPMGHKFVASQKYGSFSLFSSDPPKLFEKTPTYQSTYIDFYCNSMSYSNSAYTGPESNNVKLKKYYSSFSNAPITLNGDSSYEKITKSLEGGPIVFLDEQKNNVIIHTSGGIRRCPPVSCVSSLEQPLPADSDSYVCNSNLLYEAMIKVDGFHEYFEAHYQVDQNGDLVKIVNQFLQLMDTLSDHNSENALNRQNDNNYEVGTSGLKSDYGCYLGECSVCEGYLTANERAVKYMTIKDSFVQLKCLTDNNGNILRAMPPSARPQDLAGTLTPEPLVTPPGRVDVESFMENVQRSRYRTNTSSISDQNVFSNTILQNSIPLENNLFWGSSTDSLANQPSDQVVLTSTPSVADTRPPAISEINEEDDEEEEEEDDAEFELDQDEDEDDEDDEDEEEDEYDDELFSEDDFRPVSRPTRSSERLKKISESTPNRPTRSSIRKVNVVSDDSIEDEEDKKDVYSSRSKRDPGDLSKERQVEWARNLSVNIGPVPVKFSRDWREDFSGKVCVFCGMGEAGDYSNLTRTQSLKLSTTIFSGGNEFHPVCKLFKNTIVGPMGIPKRYHSDLDDYFTLFKRVDSSTNIFSHVSCLIASKVKLDPSNRLLNLPEVLVTCSFDVCSFCGSKFATVSCEKCDSLFHYPCAIAQYEEYKKKSRGVEVVNHFDPLVCSQFICVNCAISHEKEYLSSDCFLKADAREWVMTDSDSFENKFNIQVGDCIVLTSDSISDKYNVHISWLTQKQFPILVKVINITYIFAENSKIIPCLLIQSFFGDFDDFCIFAAQNTKLILLRDYLTSIYKLKQIKAGSKVKCKVKGKVLVTQVKSVKPFERVEAQPKPLKDIDTSAFKKLINVVFALGHNSVNIEYENKSKWIDSWDVSIEYSPEPEDENGSTATSPKSTDSDFTGSGSSTGTSSLSRRQSDGSDYSNGSGVSDNNDTIINKIKLNSFLEVDREAIVDLLGDPKFETFYDIQEADSGSVGWIIEYWKHIPRPMCSKHITERLFNQYYRTPEAICGDISLMVANSLNFNGPSTKYAKLSNELENALKKIKPSFESREEWRVILSHIWPKIKTVVDLSRSTQSAKSHTKDKSNHVQQESKQTSKKKSLPEEQPMRRSSRLQNIVEKTSKEVVEKKKTRYNLR